MATIANDGVHHTPYFVEKVVGPDGRSSSTSHRRLGEPALERRRRRLRAEHPARRDHRRHRHGQRRVAGHALFGKTGTTDNMTDAWFVGATPPQLATAVWFGNRTGNIGGAGFGGDSAAPIFATFMADALGGQAPNIPLPDRRAGVRTGPAAES